MPSAVAIADARTHLGPDSATVEDTQVQRWIDAAEDLVVQRTGPLTARTVLETVAPFNGVGILKQTPVQSVTVVQVAGVPTSAFTVDLAAGLIYLNQSATVEYVVGQLSPLVREVVLDLVRLRYDTRPDALPPGVDVAEEPLTPPFPPNDQAILARLDGTSYRHAPSGG